MYFFFSIYLLIVSVCACVSIGTCRDLKSVLDLSGARVVGHCEPPDVDAGI